MKLRIAKKKSSIQFSKNSTLINPNSEYLRITYIPSLNIRECTYESIVFLVCIITSIITFPASDINPNILYDIDDI